jgi:hypothetical protein
MRRKIIETTQTPSHHVQQQLHRRYYHPSVVHLGETADEQITIITIK